MTDSLQTALVVAAGPFIIGVVNLLLHQKQSANILKIEVATNSIKDALVKATREKALLEGAAIEHLRAKAEAAVRAEGVAAGKSLEETKNPRTPEGEKP
jgi:NADH:ubiquinone oxidoreductase subunit K